jgi:hypothetical protein
MTSKVKVGDRVELLFINDTWTRLDKGSKGTVFKIDDTQSERVIWIRWENGETLALLEGIDKYKIIKE